MNFHISQYAFFTAAILLSTATQTMAIQKAETMLQIGKWTAFREISPENQNMQACFSTYEKKSEIQIWPAGVFIKFGEAIAQVDLAFGNEEFIGLRTISSEERQFNLIRISGEELTKFLNTETLRLRILTDANQKLSRTLETKGAKEIFEYIRAGCPGKSNSTPLNGCEQGVEQKLRNHGAPDDQISLLCNGSSI